MMDEFQIKNMGTVIKSDKKDILLTSKDPHLSHLFGKCYTMYGCCIGRKYLETKEHVHLKTQSSECLFYAYMRYCELEKGI